MACTSNSGRPARRLAIIDRAASGAFLACASASEYYTAFLYPEARTAARHPNVSRCWGSSSVQMSTCRLPSGCDHMYTRVVQRLKPVAGERAGHALWLLLWARAVASLVVVGKTMYV